MAKASLAQRWQSKLTESERLFVQGSPRLRWLRGIYVRIYQFLLSQYGQIALDIEDSRPMSARGDLDSEFSCQIPVGLADSESGVVGKPPKTGEQMRATLKFLHTANEPNEQTGPLVGGLDESSWIAVQSFRKRHNARNYCSSLRSQGIQYIVQKHRKDTIVEVQLKDKDAAEQLRPFQEVESVWEKFGTSWQADSCMFVPRSVGIIAGMICGGWVAFQMAIRSAAPSVILGIFSVLSLLGAGLGFLVGYVWDRFRNRWQ